MNTEMKKQKIILIVITNIKSKSLGIFEVSEDLLRRQVNASGITLVSHSKAGAWNFVEVSFSQSSVLLRHHHLQNTGILRLKKKKEEKKSKRKIIIK